MKTGKKAIYIIAFGVLAIAIVVMVFFYLNNINKSEEKLSDSPDLSTQTENATNSPEQTTEFVTKDILGTITKEEALEDFIFLIETLEESYPYISVAERMHSLNYTKHKEHFRKLYDDEDNVFLMRKHYDRLDNFVSVFGFLSHLHILQAHEYTLYNYAYNEDHSGLAIHKEMLDKPKSISFYKKLGARTGSFIVNNDIKNNQNISASISPLQPKKINETTAYVKIDSFIYGNINADKKVLYDFYESIPDVKNLIIDIRENTGGADIYWKDLIVGPNIIEETIYKRMLLYRESNLNKKYIDSNGSTSHEISELPIDKLIKLNMDDIKNFDRYVEIVSRYVPRSDKKKFDGEIYVLVSKNVYSASTEFADFCQSPGFATLVGTNTSGGNGEVPIYASLPNSGIIVAFDNVYSINEDGECFEEVGVSPDYYIDSSQGDALTKCLEIIQSKSQN